VDDEEVADATIVVACAVLDCPTVVVAVEDVTEDGVTDGVRRRLAVVVEDAAMVPKTLSSAALVQGWP